MYREARNDRCAYDARKNSRKIRHCTDLVGVASTGVIGEKMNMEPVLKGIQKLNPTDKLEGSMRFSQAILTTDTVTKNTAYRQ